MAEDTTIQHLVKLCFETHIHMSASQIEKVKKASESMKHFYERIKELRVFEKKLKIDPYVLSLVGLTNVGKSTLMEALLGYPIAPRKNGPATATPVVYKFDTNWSIEVDYNDVREAEIRRFGDAKLLGEHLKEIVVDNENAKNLAWVTVSGPIDMLKSGLVLADTPGFGAASVDGEDAAKHETRLKEFLRERVQQVYFCVDGGDTLSVSAPEKEFFQDIKGLCYHVIVNKWTGNKKDQEKYENQYKEIFTNAEFVFVNAKKAINGLNKKDEAMVEDSNILFFHKIIQANGTATEREAYLYPKIIKACIDIHNHMKRVHNLDSLPWRELYLQQFLFSCTKNKNLGDISKLFKSSITY